VTNVANGIAALNNKMASDCHFIEGGRNMTKEELEKAEKFERIKGFINAVLWLGILVLMLRVISTQITFMTEDNYKEEKNENTTEKYILEYETFGK